MCGAQSIGFSARAPASNAFSFAIASVYDLTAKK